MYILIFLIILIDIVLLYRNKNNPLLLIANVFILYVNYSILVGEYLTDIVDIPGNMLYSTTHGNIYNLGVKLLLLFNIIRFFIFYKRIDTKPLNYNFESNTVFSILFIFLLYIAIFQVNREPSLMYEVKITPLYEYSILFFSLLIYYSGNNSFKKKLCIVLAILFIVQDMYYGGRVTSIQLTIVFLLMYYRHLLKLKYLLILLPIGLIVFVLIGSYRTNYSLDLSPSSILNIITKNLFVQDTAVYAYFSSITQIYASFYTDVYTEISSFIAFLLSIPFGSQAAVLFNFDQELSLVPVIAIDYHWNVGGGLMFSWYYFWFGNWGIIILTTLTFCLFRKMLEGDFILTKIIAIILIATIPRWYLYSPLAFWRTGFFIFPIVYLFFLYIRQLTDVFRKKILLN